MATSLDEPGPDVAIHVHCKGCEHWEHKDYFGHCTHEKKRGRGEVHGGATPWWCPLLFGAMERAVSELQREMVGNSLDGDPGDEETGP